MRLKLQPDPVDLAIAALAERQHGVVGHVQLRSLGLSRESIQRRVRVGRLHRIHRGVYAVGHKRLTQRGRWMAAVLAGAEDAHLSHRSAAALWGLLPNRGEIHVTTPRIVRNRDKISFHVQSLLFDEVTTHDGIPTTTVARTLLDIAATEPDQLERAFNEAEFRRLWDATVELDSRQAHGTTSRFHTDRERDRLFAIAGWTVVRVTSRHLTTRLATDLDTLVRR